MSNKTQRVERFKAFYPVIRDELLDHIAKKGIPFEAVEWYRLNLDYNLPNGKCVRGTFLVDVIEILQNRPMTEDEFRRAAVLGWCCELFQAFFLVYDDIMDGSLLRRGHACWCRNEKVGMIAINDAFMLESAIFHLLKMHLRSDPYYADIVDLFHELVHMTEIGQMLDLITAPTDLVDLNKFSLERQRMISKYKAAYAYYYPVAIALVVTGTPPPSSFPAESMLTSPYELAKSILIPIGIYYQDQDDYLDYAGTPAEFGKIGSDIVDNKCSWCIVTALSLASPEQRKVLDENYGRKNADCERRVREVFDEVGLRRAYKEYEETAVCKIREDIRSVLESESGLKSEIFESLLDKIYKRTK